MSRLTSSLSRSISRGVSRRNFLRTGSLAAAAGALPLRSAFATARVGNVYASEPFFGDTDDQKALVDAALAAAKAAGAVYADVQIRWRQKEELTGGALYRNDIAGFGIRSLVNGYWGFAATAGEVIRETAARLGAASVAQAKISATGRPRTAELAPTPVVTGDWKMPVEIDPFTVSLEEKSDYCSALEDFIGRDRLGISGSVALTFVKEERLFGSSEGSFTTQTVYQTAGGISLSVSPDWRTEISGDASYNIFPVAGAGWEYIRNAEGVKDMTRGVVERALASRRPKPIDVGRYDVVFDAVAIAGILNQTVGIATELDRAMGNEANGVGTSYLSDPNEMIGSFKVGSPLLNVTANRSMVRGAATVKWDDEGVAPSEFTLVKDGILNDFQTTREGASWLTPAYTKLGRPVRSNGCAGAYGATSPMQQFAANMVMQPGTQDHTFDDLVKGIKKGYALLGGWTYADQQVLNGNAMGEVLFEVIDGKLGKAISKAVVLYRAPEFWKGLVALGGKSSVRRVGIERYREDYETMAATTIEAVPVKMTGVALADITRKA